MHNDTQRERRQHLRLRYPEDDCPSAIINGKTLPLVEISCRGIIVLAAPDFLDLRQQVEAILLFHDGTTLQVAGKVLRAHGCRMVIHLSYGIPEFRVLLERQYLGQRLITYLRPRTERRKHRRIRYGEGESPFVIIGVIAFPVTELSEGGVVFHDKHQRFRLHQAINGSLLFQDGTYVNVEGKVVRLNHQRIVIELTYHLPQERVCAGKGPKRDAGQKVLAAERRRSPRIRYTGDDAPYLQIKQLRYTVVEISAQGVVLQTDDARFHHGRVVLATLRYPCGTQFLVHGTVIRKLRGFVVIRLCIEIPEAWVKAECARLGYQTEHPLSLSAFTDVLGIVGVDMKSLRQ